MKHVVGKAVSHESAQGHVTGDALYTDDLWPRYPRLLHAWPVQSPVACGQVLSIDVRDALALEGVVHVLTASDAVGEADTGAARRDEPLFPTEICYHGQALAWVLAETQDLAQRGAAMVKVETAAAEPILSLRDAETRDSFHTKQGKIAWGEVAVALKSAPHVQEGELFVGGQEHFYLETNAAIAFVDEGGSVHVHSSTQHPTETQEIVARVLGLPRSQVVVQSLRMGGAFGGKEVQANPYAAVAALGSHVTGRPVRVRLDRARDFQLTGKRHPFWGRYTIGFDDDGMVQAFDLRLISDGGWSLDLSAPVLHRALFHADNAYRIPNLCVVGRVAKTNRCSQTAFRGFGGPQGMAMIEDALDRVARCTGIPADQVRERNLYRTGDHTHYGQVLEDGDRIRTIWTSLKEKSSFETRREAIAAHNATHAHQKRGIAMTPVKFGISFTAKFYNQAGALVLIYRDGSIQLNHGGTEMGQGLHTKMRQVAAEALGVSLPRVRIMPTRTDKVPNTSATAASSGSDLNGAAIKNACDKLRSRLSQVAARMLGRDAAELIFEADRIRTEDGHGGTLSFAEVVDRAYLDRVQLSATGFYRTPRIHFDEEAGRGKPFHYFAYGAAVAEVQLDGFTGMYAIRRVDILHDVGESLSPLIDIGQIEGGFAQGLGWLTQEELFWSADGRLSTANASTYKLPTLGECPEEFHVHLLPKAATGDVIYGSKAVGEPPFMLAFSVREAIRDAVAAFATERPSAVPLGCPSTPEQVYWSIENIRSISRTAGYASRNDGVGIGARIGE